MGHDDKGGDVVVDGQKSQPEAKAIYLISIKVMNCVYIYMLNVALVLFRNQIFFSSMILIF